MKKVFKTAIIIVLALAIFSSILTCFAAELNQDAVNEHRGQFKNYVLLGDSVASGYRDVMCDEDDAYNKAYQETTYCRVPGSYADVLTKAIIEDDTMTAFAGPGFRTVEIRYMLEDDFDETDEYMFHPAQLNTVGDAGSEEYRAAYKKAVAEADLITLGVGGNDWGAYLGWVIADIFEKENVADKYTAELKEIIANNNMSVDMIEDLVEIAHVAGALPELVATLPSALSYGLGNFYKNWDIMIQDIYDLNPDVTLMVLGMSDNSVKGKYFGYNGEEGEPISTDAATQSEVVKTIVDFIMTVGNTPMIEGEEKFGYIYVDTTGTTYVESHPDADGHIHIANKIIEALPSADSPNGDETVTPDDNTDGGLTGGDNTENENPPADDSENNDENDNDVSDNNTQNDNNSSDNKTENDNAINNNNEEIPNTDAVLIIAPVAVALVSILLALAIFTKRKRIEE